MTVPRLCPGGTVVCFAGGPSLTRADVDYCRDHGAQHGPFAAIAVNNAFQLAPWADVLYAADRKWWHWFKGAPDFRGLKFALEPGAERWSGVTVLKNTGYDGLELDPGGLRTGGNSGYQAINLAIHLGAARILLLGYDLTLGPKGETHWHGPHPDGGVRFNPERWVPNFETLLAPLKALGVKVINCSRRTMLTCFPQQPIHEALG